MDWELRHHHHMKWMCDYKNVMTGFQRFDCVENEGPDWTAMHQCHGDDLCAYLTAREHQTEIHCLSMVRWNKFALRFCQNLFFLAPLISNLNRRLVGCRTESWAKRQRPVGTIYRACGASLRGCHQTLGGQGWLMEEIRKRSWDFWKRQSTKNKTRVGGFKSFQCRKFFGEDGIQVDEHIFQLADHGMPQVCCRHFKTL